ncbi:MAG: protein translocase subunit SecD [Pseudomonadota bacterium]|nr:protein translocase subunit SecD [Pseudomonadota bacterium]
MKKYPAWRYALLLIVLGVGILYALPNLYPAQPAIQVTYTDSAKSADQKLLSIIQSELFDAGIITEDLSLKNNNIVVRFQSLDDQLLAKSLLQKTLLDQIIVALKLEPTTPDWLANLGGQPLKLGLDLSGGVHFLLEVDVETALNDKTDGLLNSYRKKFRTEKISYSQSQVIDKQLIFVFRDQDSFSRAKDMFFDDSFTATGLQYDLEESASTQTLKLAYSDLAIKELRDYAVQQNLMTLRNRVNELGVSEPVVQRQGANRIVVELPGVQDTTSAKKIIGKTANLEFRLEARSETSRLRKTEFGFKNSNFGSAYLENDVIVTGDRVTNANTGFDENGQAQVNITLDMQGGRAMQRATDGNIGRRLGVLFVEQKSSSSLSVDETGQEVIAQTSYVEKNIISLATVQAVLGTNFRITGVGTPQEASELALLLRAGALAAPMKFVEERTVGPSLGKENIKLGMQSIIAGFALVILFMFIYYKFFGLAANLALTSNLILITGFMSLLGATLTLPGIAGIVLTVGMAVDANVLIFSRIREELKAGKNPHLAIQDGFSRAFITIFDANVTTLIAALILYAIGTGPIKGFAVTLSIGILTSMFTAIMGTRAIVQLMYGNRSLRELKI